MEPTKPIAPQQPKAAPVQPKKAAPQPKKAANKDVTSNVGGIRNAFWIILICFALGLLVYFFVMGNSGNFNVDAAGEKHPANMLGTWYMGGWVVPILLTCFFTVIVLTIERAIALGRASGKGNTTQFVANVKAALKNKDIAKAEEFCRKQQGTVGAVVFATLQKYKEMEVDTVLKKEQKLQAIQQTVEEATALEMPTLQQNLAVIATLTTLGTLLGLLGTVLGMIKSFQAMSNEGSPDSTKLSAGISEALVNTATGIATAALALISYNYWSNKIDKMTYAIDEVGFSIVSTFSQTH